MKSFSIKDTNKNNIRLICDYMEERIFYHRIQVQNTRFSKFCEQAFLYPYRVYFRISRKKYNKKFDK